MPKKWTHPLSDLIVKAEDCYDPADYVLVHKDYLAKLQSAAPLPASAALQAVIEKWRARADDMMRASDGETWVHEAEEIERCADDMEAALRGIKEP